MSKPRIVFIAALSAAIASGIAVRGQAVTSTMTNADVVKMVEARLSDEVVVAAIRLAAHTDFDRSAGGLIALKTKGVSDVVITALLAPSGAGAASSATPPVAPEPVNSDDPRATHPPGIYLDRGETVSPRLIALEPAVFSQAKSGGLFASAMTYGLYKAKWKAIVRGAQSQLRIANDPPTFYFYFDEKSGSLSHSGGPAGWLAGATSPNEFVLVQMYRKKDSREVIVGEIGAFSASNGTRSEDTVPFAVEKLAPGVYRVIPKETLGSGEFSFYYAATTGSAYGGAAVAGKLFDFGVDTTKK